MRGSPRGCGGPGGGGGGGGGGGAPHRGRTSVCAQVGCEQSLQAGDRGWGGGESAREWWSKPRAKPRNEHAGAHACRKGARSVCVWGGGGRGGNAMAGARRSAPHLVPQVAHEADEAGEQAGKGPPVLLALAGALRALAAVVRERGALNEEVAQAAGTEREDGRGGGAPAAQPRHTQKTHTQRKPLEGFGQQKAAASPHLHSCMHDSGAPRPATAPHPLRARTR